MTLTPALELIGRDLDIAMRRRIASRHRRVRTMRLVGASATVAAAFCAAAVASGVVGDLRLDPTKWTILGRGSVDDGRGEYVNAMRRDDGSSSTFLVEHDAGLPAYQAFLLHEKTLAAAQADPEQGLLCTPDELTRAESIALAGLRQGTSADFGTLNCRGLGYAAEQAERVYTGVQPASTLMPGVD